MAKHQDRRCSRTRRKPVYCCSLTPIRRYRICAADDRNGPTVDAHLDATNADKSYHIAHKCNSVCLENNQRNLIFSSKTVSKFNSHVVGRT